MQNINFLRNNYNEAERIQLGELLLWKMPDTVTSIAND